MIDSKFKMRENLIETMQENFEPAIVCVFLFLSNSRMHRFILRFIHKQTRTVHKIKDIYIYIYIYIQWFLMVS